MKGTIHTPYSRITLESLSTGELMKLAEDAGIDIPPGLERIFIIEELLLDISNAGNKEDKEDININPSNIESVALPKQYNISFVEVIIRDPLWVFVHWEIKGHDRDAYESAPDFAGYCLRVYPLGEGETIPKSKDNSFTVQLNLGDSARYLGFTERSPWDSGLYIITLCAICGESELQLAVSRCFQLPRLVKDEALNEFNSPLLRLSGAMDISTIKSTERQSRVKVK